MINAKDHPVAWAMLMMELDDAHEHLGNLITAMSEQGSIDIEAYSIDVAHIYAHLNRAWNTKDIPREVTDEEWEQGRAFPNDLEPLA
ncbi:MAG: hypothetical protein AAF933_12280 [Pseudomonadota bacterium]